MKDEKKLEIKKKIREWQENLKNYKKDNFWGYEVPFANMIDLTHQAYELYGYNSKSERWEYDFTKRIINALYGMLDNEYERLNRIDNPYKYVPEEWLDDRVTADYIIKAINTKWQKHLTDGRIEQEYWVQVDTTTSDKGIKYAVHKRYCGNSGYENSVYGDYGESLKECVLAFWESIGNTRAFLESFWD